MGRVPCFLIQLSLNLLLKGVQNFPIQNSSPSLRVMRVDKCKILIHNDLNFDRYALIRQPVKSSSRYGSKDCVLQPLITCKLGLGDILIWPPQKKKRG